MEVVIFWMKISRLYCSPIHRRGTPCLVAKSRIQTFQRRLPSRPTVATHEAASAGITLLCFMAPEKPYWSSADIDRTNARFQRGNPANLGASAAFRCAQSLGHALLVES